MSKTHKGTAKEVATEAAAAQTALISEEEFQRLNNCIRMSNPTLAVETVIKNVIGHCAVHMGNQNKWLHLTPNDRRADFFAVVMLASNKLKAYASRLEREGVRVSKGDV